MYYPYLVYTDTDSCVVIAKTSQQARNIAYKESSFMRDYDYTDLRAHRVVAEEYLDKGENLNTPHWVYDVETYERVLEYERREYWASVL
jgi:hemerythrin